MAESIEHRQLVERIVRYVSKRFAAIPALVVLCDRPGQSVEVPPRIAGFVPDVFAADVPTTFTVIGEAKTDGDLETTRCYLQVSAFLRHLTASPNGLFVFSVSWAVAGTARALLSSVARNLPPHSVEIVLLDGITSRGR